MTAIQVTRAEELEARCRKAMASLPRADWQHRADRRDELEYIDVLLDEYLAETPR